MSEVLKIYEEAYTSAVPIKSWWEPLRPNSGWIVAAILAILIIFRDIFIDTAKKVLGWIGSNAYKKFAGYRPFWWLALRRYRRSLVIKYEELNIPFRPGKPLKMHEVYVPIKVAGTNDADLLDARLAMLKYKWLVVTGTPGSGKSMLLKNLALTYAQGELVDFPTQPIPILLELNRLNEASVQLRDHLVEILDQNDFPNASNFLEAGLTNGLLMLMFDGLDEVNSDLRENVVNKIKDLLGKYPNCRAVVTCRAAVYNDEFADSADQKLEIVEFSDQQIQRFLISWAPDMPSDKTVENLLRNLHERPRIMTLARNPLLLTIIAYLYTDTEFVLPHSRAEFYDKSVSVLLEQWKEKRNRYKAAHKKLLLQHLALFNQNSSTDSSQDRRSLELPVLLREIKKVLPSLTLKDDDAQPILDEIVERSGLMIEVDGGIKYQFTHLTLQEFFAALALEADADGLVSRYETDRDAWRETVKLWCGLTHNSTQLIRSVYAKDPIMAFECLGDAQQVDADFSEEISNAFKDRLGELGDKDEAIIRAFGVVAADPRPRGQKLFDFLITSLTKQNIKKRRLVIAKILSLTNLPSAAEALVAHAAKQTEIQSMLIQMGDLAVPMLAKSANEGNEWAFNALYAIGTPQAASVLTPFLWNKAKKLQFQSAWLLSALLSKPNVETALRNFHLTTEQYKAEYLSWVWEPFEENTDSPITTIAGRIAYLIRDTPDKTLLPELAIVPDPRLVIPLCTVYSEGDQLHEIDKSTRSKMADEINKFNTTAILSDLENPSRIQQAKTRIINKNIDHISSHPVWRRLFKSLSITTQFNIINCLVAANPNPDMDDWRNVLKPLSYIFENSWHLRLLKSLLLLLYIFAFLGSAYIIYDGTQIISWKSGLSILNSVILLLITTALVRKKIVKIDDINTAFYISCFGFVPALSVIIAILSGNWLASIFVIILSSASLSIIVYLHSPDKESFQILLGFSVFGLIYSISNFSTYNIVNIIDSFLGGYLGGVIATRIASDIAPLKNRISLNILRKGSSIIGGVLLGIASGFFANSINIILNTPSNNKFLLVGSIICGAISGLMGNQSERFIGHSGEQEELDFKRYLIMFLVIGFISILLRFVIVSPTYLVYKTGGAIATAGFWVIYLFIFFLFMYEGERQQRRAQNPLHGILNEIGSTKTEHLSYLSPFIRYLKWFRQ